MTLTIEQIEAWCNLGPDEGARQPWHGDDCGCELCVRRKSEIERLLYEHNMSPKLVYTWPWQVIEYAAAYGCLEDLMGDMADARF